MTAGLLGSRARRAWLAAGVALALLAVVAAVLVLQRGGSPKPARRQPAAAGTTSSTQPAPPATYPLTGLPAADPAHAARPALSIKVENISLARPQAGLDGADLVTEELVEGGLTRLLVTYQSQDAPLVGPVRSVRPADALLLRQLGGGLFGFSGGAAGVLALVRPLSGATFLGPDQAPGAYQRLASRVAPHNQFTSTAALYAAGRAVRPGLGPPPALFSFAAAPPGGWAAAGQVQLRFSPASRAAWRWQQASGTYARVQDGTLDRLAGGGAVTAENVVILSVKIGRTPFVDVLGNPTPDVDLLGGGGAWVLRDGRMLACRWSRAAAGEPMRLSGPDGQPVALHPGRTWLELLPSSQRPAFRTA